jgi:hypothetical protein
LFESQRRTLAQKQHELVNKPTILHAFFPGWPADDPDFEISSTPPGRQSLQQAQH